MSGSQIVSILVESLQKLSLTLITELLVFPQLPNLVFHGRDLVHTGQDSAKKFVFRQTVARSLKGSFGRGDSCCLCVAA
ncbi:hypothetical protein KC353_g6 [Hortaea werneckii]|nr:hypothetical protein KC353_g6 [Hortaea werneckii]